MVEDPKEHVVGQRVLIKAIQRMGTVKSTSVQFNSGKMWYWALVDGGSEFHCGHYGDFKPVTEHAPHTSFATALAAAQSGDQIRVPAGQWDELVRLNDRPDIKPLEKKQPMNEMEFAIGQPVFIKPMDAFGRVIGSHERDGVPWYRTTVDSGSPGTMYMGPAECFAKAMNPHKDAASTAEWGTITLKDGLDGRPILKAQAHRDDILEFSRLEVVRAERERDVARADLKGTVETAGRRERELLAEVTFWKGECGRTEAGRRLIAARERGGG